MTQREAFAGRSVEMPPQAPAVRPPDLAVEGQTNVNPYALIDHLADGDADVLVVLARVRLNSMRCSTFTTKMGPSRQLGRGTLYTFAERQQAQTALDLMDARLSRLCGLVRSAAH